MKLLEILSRAADEEQLRLNPLPVHAFVMESDEHMRWHYALLLAAVLSAQPMVSEAQSRLFRLLLDSLQLGDIRGALFEQARDLTQETLLEACRLVGKRHLGIYLVVDVLVLLRLDAPLGDEAVRLVGELSILVGQGKTKSYKSYVALVALILGLDLDREAILAVRNGCAREDLRGVFSRRGKGFYENGKIRYQELDYVTYREMVDEDIKIMQKRSRAWPGEFV